MHLGMQRMVIGSRGILRCNFYQAKEIVSVFAMTSILGSAQLFKYRIG